MIKIKSTQEIRYMIEAGRIAAEALQAAGALVEPGITTLELAQAAERIIRGSGATPSFLGYGGFKGLICVSINDEVIHGIPGNRKINPGDMVKLDVGACLHGYHGDCANTFFAGTPDAAAQALADAARQSFYEGIKYARVGYRVSDISHAIQTYCESKGFSVVRDFVGHGIGADLHEAPEVPNYGEKGRGMRLAAGMTLAIEPMVNAGTHEVKRLSDGWTVVTKDGSLSAHYENTVLITKDEPIILTAYGSGERK